MVALNRRGILAAMKTKAWRKLDSKYVLENPWYKVRQDKVIRPDGKEGTYNVVEYGTSVFVVPITTDGKILLVRLFRYTTQREGWEVPAGGIEQGEKPLTAAKRELQEESGRTSSSWQKVGTFDLMNSITDAVAFVFEAKELTVAKHHKQDEEGITETAEFTPKQILDMIQKGQIVDALSIAALMVVFCSHGMVKDTL